VGGRGRDQTQLRVGRGRLLAHLGVGCGRLHAQLGCGRARVQPNLRLGWTRAAPTWVWAWTRPNPTCTDHFLFNHPFNAKCTSARRQPHPTPAALATFCVKSWAVITLLQSTVLCVYVNRNKGTAPGRICAQL